MLDQFFRWLTSGLSVGAVGAAIVFVVSVVQFVSVRKRESREREFDKYHALIKDLVSPGEKETMFLDRQIAIVFELRHFPRYYECTQRILSGLRISWDDLKNARLLTEIDLTMDYITRRRKSEG